MLGTSAFVLGSGLSMLGTTEAEASFSGLINLKQLSQIQQMILQFQKGIPGISLQNGEILYLVMVSV